MNKQQQYCYSEPIQNLYQTSNLIDVGSNRLKTHRHSNGIGWLLFVPVHWLNAVLKSVLFVNTCREKAWWNPTGYACCVKSYHQVMHHMPIPQASSPCHQLIFCYSAERIVVQQDHLQLQQPIQYPGLMNSNKEIFISHMIDVAYSHFLMDSKILKTSNMYCLFCKKKIH